MKRNILILLSAYILLSVIPAHAVKYRGFVDLNLGGSTSNTNLWNYDYNTQLDRALYSPTGKHTSFVNWGLSTSHGLQLGGNFYIGLGIGLDFLKSVKSREEAVAAQAEPYCLFIEEAHNYKYIWGAQYFLHLRWDGFGLFGIQSKLSPFVELKGGYLQNLSELDPIYYDTVNEEAHWLLGKHSLKGGLFIKPSIGIRLRLTDRLGLNLGLYCEPLYKLTYPSQDAKVSWYEDNDEYTERTMAMPTFNFNFFPFGINVGLDF